MSHHRMGHRSSTEQEVRYFSATWETEGTPDFGCLVDVLEMVADETCVEFAPVGYVERDGVTVIRVDGQFRRGADADELEGFAASLGKAVASEVSMRSILPDMAHPDDVATAKAIRAKCDRDRLSARDFAPLDDVDKPVTQDVGPTSSRTSGPFRRDVQLFGGTASFACDTNWDALRRATSLLDDDHDIEVSMGTIERSGERVEGVMVAKLDFRRDEEMDASEVQAIVGGSLGCELELRELGHTMAEANDLELMEKAELDTSRGFRLFGRGAGDMVGVLKAAAEDRPSKKDGTAEEQLSRIVGLDSVKVQLREAVDFATARMKAGLGRPTFHMCFKGNPGTGKTTVARALATMLAEAGVTEEDKFVEGDRETLVGLYVGHTAYRTKRAIERARGGVLFIDEAYALGSAGGRDEIGHDYGPEAIATLVKAMEDLRDNLVVVLAGYSEPMESMISMNPGLRERIAFYVDFPDYSGAELCQIADGFATRDGYTMDADAASFLSDAFEDIVSSKDADFANARIARKVVERAEMRQATLHGEDLHLHRDAFESAFSDPDIARLVRSKTTSVGF